MATKLSTPFLCRDWNCRNSNVAVSPPSQRLLPASCKMRHQRNISSQNKRQQAKKVFPERSPTNSNFPQNFDETTESENTSTPRVPTPNQEIISSADADTTIVVEHINGDDLDSSSILNETKSMAKIIDAAEPLSSIQLEDLIGMIRNAEKTAGKFDVVSSHLPAKKQLGVGLDLPGFSNLNTPVSPSNYGLSDESFNNMSCVTAKGKASAMVKLSFVGSSEAVSSPTPDRVRKTQLVASILRPRL